MNISLVQGLQLLPLFDSYWRVSDTFGKNRNNNNNNNNNSNSNNSHRVHDQNLLTKGRITVTFSREKQRERRGREREGEREIEGLEEKLYTHKKRIYTTYHFPSIKRKDIMFKTRPQQKKGLFFTASVSILVAYLSRIRNVHVHHQRVDAYSASLVSSVK